MSQLAGTEVTRQTIFLIEAGKSRPSMRTLELIASRTGKGVRSFLRASGNNRLRDGRVLDDARVVELQGLCLQLQFDKAITLGLAMPDDPMTPNVEAHVRHYVGQALVRLTRPDEGLEHLRRAQVLLEQQPHPWLAVECPDWEACTSYLKEDSPALPKAHTPLPLLSATQP